MYSIDDIIKTYTGHKPEPIGKHRFFSVLVPFVENDRGDVCLMTLEEEITGDLALDSALYYGDNLKLMKFLLENRDMKGRIKLIYIDPPFFSKSSYDAVVRVDGKNIKHPAYDDKWQNGMYLLPDLSKFLILSGSVKCFQCLIEVFDQIVNVFDTC